MCSSLSLSIYIYIHICIYIYIYTHNYIISHIDEASRPRGRRRRGEQLLGRPRPRRGEALLIRLIVMLILYHMIPTMIKKSYSSYYN